MTLICSVSFFFLTFESLANQVKNNNEVIPSLEGVESKQNNEGIKTEKSINKDGSIKNIVKYKEGIEVERIKYSYYLTGELKKRVTVINQGLEVKVEAYYVNGALEAVHISEDRGRHAKYKEFYKNGNLRVNKLYKDGKTHGLASTYNNSGDIIGEGHLYGRSC